jgi:hypothetical protein
MSDIAIDTPEPLTYRSGGLKINKPDLYYGDRMKLKT